MSKGSVRTICIPSTTFCIFLSVLSLLQIIIVIPLITHGFIQSLKNNKTLPQLFKIIYWITSFFLLITAITFPIHQMFAFPFSGHCDDFDRISITVSITLISYMISLVLISSLYLVRMILTFKHNPLYAISKPTCISLIFGIFIQSILLILTIYYDLKVWIAMKNGSNNFATLWSILGYIYLVFGVVNILYNTTLFSLFLKNIYRLGKSVTKKSDMHSLIQSSLLYSLCLFLTLSSTLITSLWGWTRSNLVIDTNELYMVHLTLIAYDVLFNAASINLQFEYYKQSLFNNQSICCCCKLSFNCLIRKLIKYDINNINDEMAISENINMPIHSETQQKATTSSSSSSLSVIQKKELGAFPFFAIHNRFIENAKIIYTQLVCMGYNELISLLISEFTATRYLNCIMCEECSFGCIECCYDYCILYGTLANYDENNKLRFFLNYEDGYSKIDNNQSNFDIDKEIICSECAMNWKCVICESLYLISDYDSTYIIEEGCDQCGCIICDNCALYYRNRVYCQNCCDKQRKAYGDDESMVQSYKSYKSSQKSTKSTQSSRKSKWEINKFGYFDVSFTIQTKS